jgi:peptide deformylase
MTRFHFIGISLFCSLLQGCSHMSDLPPYVVVNNPKEENVAVLRNPAQPLTFPLSDEDQEIIRILEAKFDQEEDCAGLAAPQIGFGKQIIVFAAPDDPKLKKWRPDLAQTMGKTVWINPSYEPIGTEKHTDYEACFSVADLAGPVPRYKAVRYKAYTPEGTLVEGTAEGFLARAIQHEVDHLNGTCFIDYVPKEELMTIDECERHFDKRLEKISS